MQIATLKFTNNLKIIENSHSIMIQSEAYTSIVNYTQNLVNALTPWEIKLTLMSYSFYIDVIRFS